jgi:hypothetical protein
MVAEDDYVGWLARIEGRIVDEDVRKNCIVVVVAHDRVIDRAISSYIDRFISSVLFWSGLVDHRYAGFAWFVCWNNRGHGCSLW